MPVPITIDADRCKKDGLCVQVCPWVFGREERRTLPAVVHPENCVFCGHCVAVCPSDAIAIPSLDMANFPRQTPDMNLEPRRLQDFLRLRRSVRNYRRRGVPRKVVQAMLEAGRYAPSGNNAQMLQYVVVQDRETIDTLSRLCTEHFRESLALGREALASKEPEKAEKLHLEAGSYEQLVAQADAGEDPIFYRAPGLVVIHASRETPTPVEDATLAAYNMMLMAQTMGVGTCYIGWFYFKASESQAIRHLLSVPPENDIYMAFAFGYPALRFMRLVDRRQPEVHWL